MAVPVTATVQPVPSAPSPARPVGPAAALAVAVALLGAACTGEEAIPIDPANPPVPAPDLTDVTHRLEPTEQMRQAAEQQCRDDPDLVEGYVRAVDPATGDVLSELSIDCADVTG